MSRVKFPEAPILIVDDEIHFLKSAEILLRSEGINNIELCNDSREVMGRMEKGSYSMVLLDLMMPGIRGQELLDLLSGEYPDIPVVILTASDDSETVVECMKAGAYDYLVKPVDDSRLLTIIRNGVQLQEMRQERRYLRESLSGKPLKNPSLFDSIVTINEKMHGNFQYAEAISVTGFPVLITGETGTGKQLMAEIVHKLSGRTGAFVELNIAAEDPALIRDNLFGHEKGGFTSAHKERKGLIETASEGTIFLDEIGDLTLDMQVTLLKLIQDKRYFSIGSDREKLCNARFIFATNCDLEKMKDEGTFRKDLYYRLCSHHIHLPPLRDRREDIPYIFEHYINSYSEELQIEPPGYSEDIRKALIKWNFPGNIRELQGMVADAVSRSSNGMLSEIPFEKLVESGVNREQMEVGDTPFEEWGWDMETFPTLKKAEEYLIKEALRRCENNQTRAAEMLGVSRKTINQKLKTFK